MPKSGRYEVRYAYTMAPNRATNVPVTVVSADGAKTVSVNEKRLPDFDKAFVSLGILRFTAEEPVIVNVGTDKTDGYVVADAIQLLPVE